MSYLRRNTTLIGDCDLCGMLLPEHFKNIISRTLTIFLSGNWQMQWSPFPKTGAEMHNSPVPISVTGTSQGIGCICVGKLNMFWHNCLKQDLIVFKRIWDSEVVPISAIPSSFRKVKVVNTIMFSIISNDLFVKHLISLFSAAKFMGRLNSWRSQSKKKRLQFQYKAGS